MKTFVLLSAFTLLAIVGVQYVTATPLAQQSGAAPGGQKPGSCYRPGSGRKRRSLTKGDEEYSHIFHQDPELQQHDIQKRQVGSNGGSQGGNPWKPPAPTQRPTRPTQRPRPQCYNDNDCTANKKCCSGVCQTPSFVG